MRADSSKAQAFRAQLVDHLRETGRLRDPALADAFRAVPRHLFVPERPLDEAYADRALGTKTVDDRVLSSISQPTMIAIMLAQLALQPGQRVLEIGAGSGYQAALMAQLVGPAGHVVTIDIDDDIVAGAKRHLATAGIDNVTVLKADGSAGYAAGGPYDRIILTVAAGDIAPAWWQQLKRGGRLVLPLVLRPHAWQQCAVLVWDGAHFRGLHSSGCRFIQLRGELALPEPVFKNVDPDGVIQAMGSMPVAKEQLRAWLAQPAGFFDTGITVNWGPPLMALNLWLSLHDPDLTYLFGKEGAAMPALFQTGGAEPVQHTYAVVGTHGLAALSLPPALLAKDNSADERAPFKLHLCQCGPDDRPLRQLLALVRAWQHAGQPLLPDLAIQVYPQPAPADVSGDFILDRKYTQIVLDWPGQPQTKSDSESL